MVELEVLAALRHHQVACRADEDTRKMPPQSAARPFPSAIPPRVAGAELVVVTGKGGVGKSTVAAALGQALAASGRRVLVVEVDPRENVHQLLGAAPSGGEIVAAGSPAAGSPAGGLWLQHLAPRTVLDRVIRRHVRPGAIARRLIASPLYHQLAEGMPGLRELAVIQHARDRTSGADGAAGDRFDTVVLDAPATGHGVTLLASPLLVAEAIPGGPVGELAADLAALVADSARCGIVVVTAAEEMAVDESLELAGQLDERLDRRPGLLVVNGLYPPLDNGGDTAGEALDLWRRRRRINERQLARLDEAWHGPRLELPLLPIDRGPRLVAELAASMGSGLATGGGT